VAIENSVLEAEPQVGEELFLAFQAARGANLLRLPAGTGLTPRDQATIELSPVLGGDPFPFGVEVNCQPIGTLVQFAVDPQIFPNSISPKTCLRRAR
jgi:4,5-dihydroxyphthalate decarboxylase